MRLLLDTHAIVWWLLSDDRLSAQAADAIGHRENSVYVSVASGWEIATKVRRGRFPSMASNILTFEADVSAEGFIHLPALARHCIQAGLSASNHGDPFDRLMAAQALLEDMTLVTRDREMASFGCRTLW